MKQVRTLTSNLGNIKRKISADDGHFLQTGILYKYLAKKKTIVALRHLGSTNSKTNKKVNQNYMNFFIKS